MTINRRAIVITIVGVLVVAVPALFIITLLGPMLAGPVQGCTMIGCFNTLTIRFEGFQPERFRVEVSSPDGDTYRFECPEPEPSGPAGFGGCNPDGVTLSEATPDDITVTVSWEGGSKTETFHVNYLISQPNGPQCEPTCKSAIITMRLP